MLRITVLSQPAMALNSFICILATEHLLHSLFEKFSQRLAIFY